MDLTEITEGQVIAIDGKTLRGSYDKATGKSAIHMVSAWATANRISLGQVVVDEKSNEITAIPKLLETLDICGAMVTIDAMGCQTEIAAQIVEQGGDYCLAVKGNQPTLQAGIAEHFETEMENDFAGAEARVHTTEKCGHGREETRRYIVCPVPEQLPDRARWKGLKAIGLAINTTYRDGKITTEVRYYILSTYPSAKDFAAAVRGHWGIENQLHWHLDVSLLEGLCRVRKRHAAANLSILRRTALAMLLNETSLDVGIKIKRLMAAWDTAYLEKVLFS